MSFRLSRRSLGKLAAVTPFLPNTLQSGATPETSTKPGDTASAFAELSAWLDGQLESLGVPGAALGVIADGKFFTHTSGVVDSTAEDAIESTTAFRIASLTKIFTASATSKLAHAGQVDITQPVVTYLPDFRVADTATSETVTTAHLLSHSGGWADSLEPDPTHEDLAYYVGEMRELPQVAPVGTHLSYSNSGYLLAGHLLATLTGAEYEEVIRTNVLDPLGLGTTGFDSEGIEIGLVARGHSVGEDGAAPVESDVPPRAANPSFGIRSSVDDLLIFLDSHLKAVHDTTSPFAGMLGPLGSGGAVGPSTVDHIGMGWMLRDINGHQVAMSQGSDTGFCAAMAFAPADGFAIVVLTNSDAALMLVNDLLWEGFTRILGLTEAEVVPIVLDDAARSAATGTFALWDGMAFETRDASGGLELTTSVGGEPVPDLTGSLGMTSEALGFLNALGGQVWFDFVQGDTGSIDWIRFAGRLAPRTI